MGEDKVPTNETRAHSDAWGASPDDTEQRIPREPAHPNRPPADAVMSAAEDEERDLASSTEEEEKAPPTDPFDRMAERLEHWEARLDREIKVRRTVLAVVRGLRKGDAWRSAPKVRKLVRKARKKLDHLGVTGGPAKVLDALDRWEHQLPGLLLDPLWKDLIRLTEQRNLTMRRVRFDRERHLLVVRILPFEVQLDAGAGEARLLFAEEVLATTALKADRILGAHGELRRSLDASFHSSRFFAACLTAYRQALAAKGGRFGERVELRDLMPLLALQMQPQTFRSSLEPRRYLPYTRGRFAYHIWKLRQAQALQQKDGQREVRMRMSLATGVSGSQPRRVVLLENEMGEGSRYLGIYFEPIEHLAVQDEAPDGSENFLGDPGGDVSSEG